MDLHAATGRQPDVPELQRALPSSARRSLILWLIIFAVIVAGFIAGGLVTRHAVAGSFDLIEQLYDARSLSYTLLDAQLDEETGIRGYAATHDRQFLEPYYSGYGAVSQSSSRLQARLMHLGLPSAAPKRRGSWCRSARGFWARRVAKRGPGRESKSGTWR